MAKLQKPKFAYMGGKIRSWDEATLHVGCEGVIRCAHVFEGVKGYWQPDGKFGIVMLRQHYERLCRSSRLLHIPFSHTYDDFKSAIYELIGLLLEPDRDMWARPTLFAIEGHWGEDTVSDLVVTAFHQDKQLPQSINLGVSTWQRSSDVSLPSRVKTGTNYQVGRLAKIEGRRHGCQDMVLLNQWGRVAEATGSCLLIVREGVVCTPPVTEGALESITVDIVEALAHSLGVKFDRRPIDRSELLVAEEIATCGTLCEVTLVKSIEGIPLVNDGSILESLQNSYHQAVRGIVPHSFVELSYLPSKLVSVKTG
ncbi:MAG: aminotransferase class IV [Candidatus Scalindua sp.]|nr:aminotransferase class IV [Candidatus Scalindua sp.]